MAKYNKSTFPIFLVRCPECFEDFDSELMEDHLSRQHQYAGNPWFSFELTRIEFNIYYYKLALSTEKQNYSTRKGLSSSLNVYNTYIEKTDPGIFVRLYTEPVRDIMSSDFVLFEWKDIHFEKDGFSFRKDGIYYPSIYYHGLSEKWNVSHDTNISGHIGKIFQFRYENNRFDLSKSPGYFELLNLFDNHINYLELKQYSEFEILDTTKLSNADITNIPQFRFYDNDYLKYLFELHDIKSKLVPILERNNGKKEPSIIFKVLTRNKNVLVIWENYKPSRACHIFLDNGNDNLDKIKSYIVNHNQKHKRKVLYLRESESLCSELGYIGAIKHTKISLFRKRIEFFLSHN